MSEATDYKNLRTEDDHDDALKFVEIVQRISQHENVPFNDAWKLAKQRFPTLFEKIGRTRRGLHVAAGSAASNVEAGIAVGNAKYSPLLGCDPASVSPAQARQAFDDEVARVKTQHGMDFTAAWNHVARTHPEVLARSGEEIRKEVADTEQGRAVLPNALTGLPAPRAGKPHIAPALGLPSNATDDEYDVAWNANGRQHTNRDDNSILTALIAYLMQKYGFNVERAKREASERYPRLWDVAGDKPVSPRTQV